MPDLEEARRRLEQVVQLSAAVQAMEQRIPLDHEMDALRELERAIALQRRNLIEQNRVATDGFPAAEIEALQARIQAMQMQIEAQQRAARANSENQRNRLPAFDVTAGAGGGARGNNSAVGRSLQRVSTPGLSEAVRTELISRLPLREGDFISQQAVEQIRSAVRSYDEHLRVQFVPTYDGQAEIRISAPGNGR